MSEIGMLSAEYDVGTTARDLSLFYIHPDRDAWQQLLTLLRTAGPRARMYESAAGVLTFRDVSTPASVATLRGRRSGLTTGAVVSDVDNDEAGRERIINVARIPYAGGDGGGATRRRATCSGRYRSVRRDR